MIGVVAVGITTSARSAGASPTADTWTQLTPPALPPAGDFVGIAYDAATSGLVVFGEFEGHSETWTWTGSTWKEQTPSTSPPALDYSGPMAMAYDPATAQVVLFDSFDSETWTWDGSRWTARSPATSPSAGGSMAYDVSTSQMILFNGQTWNWDGSNWTELNPATAALPGSMAYDPSTSRK